MSSGIKIPSTSLGLKHVVFVFIGICFTLTVSGLEQKSFYFDNLTRQRGLVQSNIRTITSDHKGYVWLGSSDGLYKWDGLSLSVYRNRGEDSISLSDPNITALYEDPDHSGLWIGTTFGGLNFLDYSTYHFRSWLTSANNEHHLNNITAISRINDSTLVAGTNSRGLFILHFSGSKLVRTESIHNDETGKQYRVFSIKKTGNETFAGTSKGLFIFSEKGEPEFFSKEMFANQNQESWIKDFAEVEAGQIIIATNQGLGRWKPEEQNAVPIKLQEELGEITTVAPSSRNKNHLWAGTLNSGLYYINIKSGEVVHHATSETNGQGSSIVHNQINDLLFYPHQPILMAATPAGVSSADFGRILFNSYDLREWSDAGNTSVFFVMEDSRERLWFWSLAGLYRQKQPGEKFTKLLNTQYGKNKNLVRGGTETSDSSLFFATSNGLLEMHTEQPHRKWHTFTHQNIPDEELNNLKGLRKDQSDHIWLVSPRATIMFDKKENQSHIYPFPLEKWDQSSIDVSDLIFSEKDSITYIGTKGPWLLQLDTKTGSYQRIPTNPDTSENNENIKSNHIMSMDIDNQKRLWIATYGNGLLYLDKENQCLRDDYAQGTLAGNTYAVRFAADDHLWMSTDYGITRLNPENKTTNEFGLQEGTFCQEFNERAIYETQKGHLLMGGTNGFVRFHPEKIRLNNYIPPVYISSYFTGKPGVTKEDGTMREVLPLRSKEIEIPYHQKVISFETSVLNFRHPSKNRISWKLEGFDEEWSEAPASHIISYSNLNPGKYRLYVKGANNHGVWNDKGDYLDIHIKAPFYMRWWFPWAIGIFLVAAVIFAFWLRTKILRRQKHLLHKLVQEKTQNLRQAYQKLEESQRKVIDQNKELKMHRNELEKLVTRRTADLERAKKQAEEADRLKTSFLANLSHEIRTPMNAIVGFSSLLNNMDISEQDKNDFVRMIQQSGENLLTLINDIIDISRIETGQMTFHPESFQLDAFLHDIIKSVSFDPEKKENIDLKLNIPEKLNETFIYTDKQRLRQVITNLLSNALKFTNEGHVILSVDHMKGNNLLQFIPGFETKNLPEEVILFMIEDTGIGISMEHQKNIFEPFRKAEGQDEIKYGGMGLGLSIVKSILPVLGGDLTFKSQPGYGTTFYFYIPYNKRSLDS
ncbi:MAG: ATP-binding protein [Bacteroidota bacterium]